MNWEALAVECKIIHWGCLQRRLRTRLVTDKNLFNPLSSRLLVGGVDISFSPTRPNIALAACVVIDATKKSLPVVYEGYDEVLLVEPYVPGYLAFREVQPLASLLMRIPHEFRPDVVMVDGNGVLHQNGFGLASHLGVLTNVPTIGIGKTIFHIDGLNDKNTTKEGDLIGRSGKVHGYAICNGKASRVVYVSVGHGVTLPTAVALVKCLSLYRIPEPIRQADLRSRRRVS